MRWMKVFSSVRTYHRNFDFGYSLYQISRHRINEISVEKPIANLKLKYDVNI